MSPRKTTKAAPLRAALYCRVSTTNQAKEGTISGQVTKTREYAESRGWEVVGEFKDDGVSGSVAWDQRPASSRLLAALDRGEVDVVVMTKLDRFARSVVGGLTDFHRVKATGAGVVFLDIGAEGVEGGSDTLDTTSPTGEVMFVMLLVFAQFERRLIAQRMGEGMAEALAQNLAKSGRVARWLGGHLPLGYMTADGVEDDEGGTVVGTVVEDPEHSKTVRRVFELRAEGLATTAIAERLNDEGYRPKVRNGTAHDFGYKLVGNILKQGAYLGAGITREIRGDVWTFEAPALIEPELAEAAANFRGRRKVPKNAGKRVRTYGLSERIYHDHGDELRPMFGLAKVRKSGAVRRYKCRDAQTNTAGTCSGLGELQGQRTTSVQADRVEAAVLRYLLTKTADDWRALETAERERRAAESGAYDFAQAERDLADIDARIEALLDEFAKRDGGKAKELALATIDQLERDRVGIENATKAARLRDGDEVLSGLTVDKLLSMPIADEGDAAGGETYETTEELREALLRAANATLGEPDRYGRTPLLPDFAVETVARLAARWDISVALWEDPDNPSVPFARITIGGVLKGASMGGSWGNKVTMTLSTHSENALTSKDTDLAARFDELI